MLRKNIIVIGGTGFIGSTICSMLKKDKKKFLSLNRNNCDLLKKNAANNLNKNRAAMSIVNPRRRKIRIRFFFEIGLRLR